MHRSGTWIAIVAVATLLFGTACVTYSGNGGTLRISGNDWTFQTSDGRTLCGTFDKMQRTMDGDELKLTFTDQRGIDESSNEIRASSIQNDCEEFGEPISASLTGQASCTEGRDRGAGQATLKAGSKTYRIQTTEIDNCITGGFPGGGDVEVSGTGGTLFVNESGWRWETPNNGTYFGVFDVIQYEQSSSGQQKVQFTDSGRTDGRSFSLQGQVTCELNEDEGDGLAKLTVGSKSYVIQSDDVQICEAF